MIEIHLQDGDRVHVLSAHGDAVHIHVKDDALLIYNEERQTLVVSEDNGFVVMLER